MKLSTFSSRPLLALALFCFASCGSQDDNKTAETTPTDSTNTAAPVTPAPAPASTVSTSPENMMVVRHKVANFNKWLTSYDEHDSMRTASGVHNYVIGRGVKDSNTVIVAVKVDDMSKGKAFAKDPGLKKAMQKGGVVGAPMINFTVMTYLDQSNISSDLRSRTTFSVKDWDVWQKSFDSARQVRTDNGLLVRGYGHDADDNHKVTVVVAIMDTAKAFAFWKSDQIKQMQAQSGVVGPTDRFLYRVVKKY
jgi:hypothetical protein